MHPADCEQWDYEAFPNKKAVLSARLASTLAALAGGTVDTVATTTDTRSVHRFFFEELTRPNARYVAGHYRGEVFRCLQYLEVGIPSDPSVGAPPRMVGPLMQEVADEVRRGFVALDADHGPRTERLRYIVVFTCRLLELFLRIHPYANGNGHMGRLIVWTSMGRYGHWPKSFPIDPRPAPPYVQMITEYRAGNRDALELYILRSLLPPPPPTPAVGPIVTP